MPCALPFRSKSTEDLYAGRGNKSLYLHKRLYLVLQDQLAGCSHAPFRCTHRILICVECQLGVSLFELDNANILSDRTGPMTLA